ncbi:MAG: aminotransferase class V-fold PLP-dependent enzyme [Candidatus Eremiobacteraeota bacterium]|nr:aminotransferase class V-fold PLP-dependent enzyme [Candidatus Eremiobacteraeota bacterium]
MAYKADDRRGLAARMTLGTSPPLARELFALDPQCAYLNHAAVGVLPLQTRDALRKFVDEHARAGVLGVFPYEVRLPAFREAIAGFVGAHADEIAVLRNTGDGANVIAHGLTWQVGDEIVTNDNEFGANAYPWLRLQRRGINVRFIETGRERMTPDVLRKAMSSRTRLVTLSWVTFSDGYRHDLAELAQVAHAGNALIAVDVVQGLGAFPLDLAHEDLDFAYGGGAKWLMALQGVSFLYVRKSVQEQLSLSMPGWRSMSDIWDFCNYSQPPLSNASRFEGGTPNFIGALSLAESINVLTNAGPSQIAAHVLALTDYLVTGLRSQGAEISGARGAKCSSAIVTFSIPGTDCVSLGKHLQQAGFISTYRPSGIRIAPHGYNTFEEIGCVLHELQNATRILRSA